MPREQSLFPKITEQGLDDLRRRIGVKITDTLEPWCYEATRDNIRHYAHGIGDDNPLWCDPDYAAGTRWGGMLAPRAFSSPRAGSSRATSAGSRACTRCGPARTGRGICRCGATTRSRPRRRSRS